MSGAVKPSVVAAALDEAMREGLAARKLAVWLRIAPQEWRAVGLHRYVSRHFTSGGSIFYRVHVPGEADETQLTLEGALAAAARAEGYVYEPEATLQERVLGALAWAAVHSAEYPAPLIADLLGEEVRSVRSALARLVNSGAVRSHAWKPDDTKGRRITRYRLATPEELTC